MKLIESRVSLDIIIVDFFQFSGDFVKMFVFEGHLGTCLKRVGGVVGAVLSH